MNWEVRIMRFATSYFDRTIYKKEVTRFWPLWALYTVVWLFLLPFQLIIEATAKYPGSSAASRIERLIFRLPVQLVGGGAGLALAVIMGILTAMAVWSYLYNSRSANMMHTLPVRREGHFITRYLAGITMFVIPHLIVLAVTALTEMAWGVTALGILAEAMGYQTLMCLFFFSLATMCAMLTGHLLALPAFYGITQVLAVGLAVLMDWLGSFFLFGYNGGLVDLKIVQWLTPVWALTGNFSYISQSRVILQPDGSTIRETAMNSWSFYGGWILWVYAAAGLLLAGLALLLYRKRHMETAGDVVAQRWLHPVFLFGVALCAGLSGSCLICEIFDLDELPFLIFGLLLFGLIGYYAALMLLNKSFKVLRKGWKGCLAVMGGFLLLCGVLELDLFGVESRVPDTEKVASVYVRGVNTYPAGSGNYLSSRNLTDPELIETVTAVHRVLAERGEQGVSRVGQEDLDGLANSLNDFVVDYTLKNGSRFTRRYDNIRLDYDNLSDPESLEYLLTELVNDRTLMENQLDLEQMSEGTLIGVSYEDAEQMRLTAICSDPSALQFSAPTYWEEWDGNYDGVSYVYGSDDPDVPGGAAYSIPVATESSSTLDISKEGVLIQGKLLELHVTDGAMEKLRQAVLNDFYAGRLGVRYLFWGDPAMKETVYSGEFTLYYEAEHSYYDSDLEKMMTYTSITERTLDLTVNAAETLAVLAELGFFDEGGAQLRTESGT